MESASAESEAAMDARPSELRASKKLWGLGAVFKMIATGGAGSIFDDAGSAEVEGRLTVAVTGAGDEAATRVEAGCNTRSSVAGAAAANLLAANSMAQTMASFTRALPRQPRGAAALISLVVETVIWIFGVKAPRENKVCASVRND